jgi:hypothetical protein
MKIKQFDIDDDSLSANDNSDAPSPERRRVPRHVMQERADFQLALAGYDPAKIPLKLHSAAARVVWCFRSGLFNPNAVALACELSRKKVVRTIAAMRQARAA